MTLFIVWVVLGLLISIVTLFFASIDVISEEAVEIIMFCYWCWLVAIPVFIIAGFFELYIYCQKHKKEIRIFLKIDKREVKVYNIVKTEEKRFLIEYQPIDSVEIKVVNKQFKTRHKAEAWVAKNFTF